MVPFPARISAGAHPIDIRSRVSPASRVVPIRRVDSDLAAIKSSEGVREDSFVELYNASVLFRFLFYYCYLRSHVARVYKPCMFGLPLLRSFVSLRSEYFIIYSVSYST